MYLGNGGFLGIPGGGVFNQTGGVATVDDLHVSFGPSSPGIWTVSGSGSLTVTNELHVGEYGAGSLIVSPGAGFTASGMLSVATNAGSSGTFITNGQSYTTSTTSVGERGPGLVVQNGGTHVTSGLTLGGGTNGVGVYSLNNGTLIVNGDLTVGGSGLGTFIAGAGRIFQ